MVVVRELVAQPGQLGPHLHAQLGVEVGQRLVHQERLRLAHHRPAHRDALALAARELGRLAVEQRLEAEHACHLPHLLRDSAFGRLRSFRPMPRFWSTVMCG